MSTLKLIDLCAGTGAFSYAFQKTNKVTTVFANDFDESSKKIYDLNFSHQLTYDDLHNIATNTIPSHDILTCGFSCQPFSIAGKQQGFNDQRSDIFWKVVDIIKYHQPKVFILENVKNILTHDNGNSFQKILDTLTSLNYNICYNVLNTSDITNIPQHRERVYIVGILDDNTYDKFNLDFPTVNKLSISNILENNIADKYYYSNNSVIWNSLKSSVTKKNTVYQYRRVYVRENKSNECPTLTANMGEGGHNVPIILDDKGIRKLTSRECFNFQGFPSTYKLPNLSDGKLYKLAGNAVSVPVVELIANRLINLLY
jgi:DNA (cytosine-5)-methyltransferase 1